jgi:ATP-binding cassette subfamily B protein
VCPVRQYSPAVATLETEPTQAPEPIETDPLALVVAARSERRTVRLVWSTLRRTLKLVAGVDRRRSIFNVALQVVVAGLVAVQLVVGRVAISRIIQGGTSTIDLAAFWPLLVVALAASLTQAVTGVVQQQQRVIGEAVTRRVTSAVLDVTSDVDLARYDDDRFHDLLQRVQTFALSRPLEVTSGLVAIGTGALTTVALLVVLLFINPLLVPLLVVGAAPLVLIGRATSRAEFEFAVAQTLNMRRRHYLNFVLSDKSMAKEVRAFRLSRHLLGRWHALYDEHLVELRRLVRRRSQLTFVSGLLSALALAATLLILFVLIRSGHLNVSEAAITAFALRLVATRIQMLVGGLGKLLESTLFLGDLEGFLSLTARPGAPDAASAPGRVAAVSVRDVTFGYPGSTHPAVYDVNVNIAAGEVHALVGENGSGKTTLAKLIGGLYAPSSGSVEWLVDGQEISREHFADNATVLFQDFARYELSLRDNVALGRADDPVDDSAVIDALSAAGLTELLGKLPDGLDTVLSKAYPRGRDLSIGQWQRVALARVFYRKAPLVILDEPTASLDARAEHALFEDLRNMLAGRSVVLVSHRFSNVRMADRIHVLSDGRVVETGSHDELMQLNGLYAELYLLQATAYGLVDDGVSPTTRSRGR